MDRTLRRIIIYLLSLPFYVASLFFEIPNSTILWGIGVTFYIIGLTDFLIERHNKNKISQSNCENESSNLSCRGGREIKEQALGEAEIKTQEAAGA